MSKSGCTVTRSGAARVWPQFAKARAWVQTSGQSPRPVGKPPEGKSPSGQAKGEIVVSRLVVVSNRVPLPSERGPRAGGLAVALADALRPGSLWFGWSGRRAATPAEAPEIAHADDMTYATVDITEAEYRAYYVGFAN